MRLTDHRAAGELGARSQRGDAGAEHRFGEVADAGQPVGEGVADLGPRQQQVAPGTGIGRRRTGERERQLTGDRMIGEDDAGARGCLAALQPIHRRTTKRLQSGLGVGDQGAPHRPGTARVAPRYPAQQIAAVVAGVALGDGNGAQGHRRRRPTARGQGDAVGAPTDRLQPHRPAGAARGWLRPGLVHPDPRL